MEISFELLQEAFVQGQITLEQFIEILIDNFGEKDARRILKKNIKIALRKEQKAKIKESKQMGSLQ